MTLYEMTGAVKQLYEMLTAEEIDEQTLKDTMEAIGAEDKIDAYCKLIRQLDNDAAGIATEIDRLAKLKKTAENSKDRLKKAVIEFMNAQEKQKIETTLFKIAISEGKAVNFTDTAAIPDKFKIAQEPKIDKLSIRALLLAGETVPGAELQITEGLRIR